LRLAEALRPYGGDPDVVVLGLPRGGVPVAYEIARTLGAPLDVLIVRKVGVPGHSELAMGAISTGDIEVVDQSIIDSLGISPEAFEQVAAHERAELVRRERVFRSERAPVDVRGKTVILVDDGLATGSSMKAAIAAVRRRHPARIICAVPVGSDDRCRELGQHADQMICLVIPHRMHAVGLAYEDFSQTSDAEVRQLLDQAAHEHPVPGPARAGA
jgi:predicted phosphoribosyltransferase